MTKNHEYIIADHIKAIVFLISDGVKPSGKQQGYVLRRLIRRLFSSSLALGIDITNQDYYKELTNSVVAMYDGVYDLASNEVFVVDILGGESVKYNKAISRGQKEWEKLLDDDILNDKIKISDNIFGLYQTHGVPLELSYDILEESGVEYDEDFLNKLITDHQQKSQAESKQKFKGGLGESNEKTTRLHTATHLLHKTLRDMFGDEIKQRGSAITTQKARFDFSFDRKLDDNELNELASRIQEKIDKNLDVDKQEMTEKEARDLGAIGLFGEKYGDIVTVYSIKDKNENVFSREFCGGPHVNNTSEIGQFKILKQKSVGSGIKRIEFDLD